MSIETFSVKVGDTAPALTVEVSAPSLLGATATFAMRKAGALVLGPVAASLDVALETVTYDWQDGDTDVAGEYEAEFTVTYLTSKEGTFPTDPLKRYIQVTILPCIGTRPPMELPLIFDGSWLLDGTYRLDGRKVPI